MPQNIEYSVDGVRVPLLFHDGVVSSVIQPGLVNSINVFPSAVPARFGGVAGGVIELDTRPPATQLHGEAAAKLYEASALLESPFAEYGTVLAAARIGYPTLVTQIFEKTVNLSYWDYQTRGTWKLGTHDQIAATYQLHRVTVPRTLAVARRQLHDEPTL